MKMQFQMSSMRTVGDPIMYFTMYPGRFASAHLQGVDAPRAGRVNRGTLTVKPTPDRSPRRRRRAAARAGGAAAPAAARAGGSAAAAGGGGRRRGLAVGEDSVDWVKVFQAAKIGGLKNYFVEQDWESRPSQRGVPEDIERH